MQRTQHSFIKNVKERRKRFILFIKNAKELENVSLFWKELKRTQEHCVLLKRMYAQPCLLGLVGHQDVVDVDEDDVQPLKICSMNL